MLCRQENRSTVFVTVWRVDSQVDGQRRYSLVGTSQTIGICFNLPTDFVKIGEHLALAVEELPVFWKRHSDIRKRQSAVHSNSALTGIRVDQLQDQWPSGDDAGTTR